MTIFEILSETGIPCAYSHFKDKGSPKKPPYIAYMGSGQSVLEADNTHYLRENRYRIEYYFTTKNTANETAIEDKLLEYGYLYTKSEDVYIESEGVFVIYYDI